MLTYLVIANPICAARGVNIALGGKHAMKSQPCRKFSFFALYHLPTLYYKGTTCSLVAPRRLLHNFPVSVEKRATNGKIIFKTPISNNMKLRCNTFQWQSGFPNEGFPISNCSSWPMPHLCTGHWSKVLQTQLNVGSFSITNFTTFLIWIDLTSKLSFVPKREY